MITGEMEKLYPSAKTLVKDKVASRIHGLDDSLYNFSESAQETARNFMGWATLASEDVVDIEAIKTYADRKVAEGIDTVILVGQGGSTQAPMTLTKYNKQDKNRVSFKTLDSDSPVRLRETLATAKLENTLIIISSKSGSTIEPRMILLALRDAFGKMSPDEPIEKHLVAITDPGSDLE